METNFLVYIISHITITGYKTKTTTALHAFKIRHKLSVVNSLNACPYPEPALTHLSSSLVPRPTKNLGAEVFMNLAQCKQLLLICSFSKQIL